MGYVETIAFVLIKDEKVLVERRKMSKKMDPGKIVIPGGHVDEGESPKESCIREMNEELTITSNDVKFACTLLHPTNNKIMKVHYFLVNFWEGNICNNEAEELLWIPLNNLSKLSFDVDRVAIKEISRIF